VAKLKKKKICWEGPGSCAPLKYRLYWAADGGVGYGSNYIELQDVTEVILPDAIPIFWSTAQDVQFGISAVNEAGNESDITELSARLDFSIPKSPKNPQLLDIAIAKNPKNLRKVVMASLGIIFLTVIGIFGLLTLGNRTLGDFDKIIVNSRNNEHVASGTSVSEPVISSVSKENSSEKLDESEVDAGSFNVEAIIWSNDQMNSFALINGSEVRVGESVGKAVVTEIGRDYVAFQVGESRFRITME
jgi:hypothetical protein